MRSPSLGSAGEERDPDRAGAGSSTTPAATAACPPASAPQRIEMTRDPANSSRSALENVVSSVEFSRPAALAAKLLATDVSDIEHLFTAKQILLRLEQALGEVRGGAGDTDLLANEVLRFCRTSQSSCQPPRTSSSARCEHLAAGIHGHSKITLGTSESSSSDATVNIGTEIRAARELDHDQLRRLALPPRTSNGTAAALPPRPTPFQPVRRARRRQSRRRPSLPRPHQHASAPRCDRALALHARTGDAGRARPRDPSCRPPIELDALLVGCGGVGNGWVYTIRRAPAAGRVEAVDHQAYDPRTSARTLREPAPAEQAKGGSRQEGARASVHGRAERRSFPLLQGPLRLRPELRAEIVVSALDNPPHAMTYSGCGRRLRSTRRRGSDFTSWWSNSAATTGCASSRRTPIRAAGMLNSWSLRQPPDCRSNACATSRARSPKRTSPERLSTSGRDSRRRADARRPICGRVADLDLNEEEYSSEFAPAVPFVTAFAGVVAAAQTVKAALEPLASLHYQFSFQLLPLARPQDAPHCRLRVLPRCRQRGQRTSA